MAIKDWQEGNLSVMAPPALKSRSPEGQGFEVILG